MQPWNQWGVQPTSYNMSAYQTGSTPTTTVTTTPATQYNMGYQWPAYTQSASTAPTAANWQQQQQQQWEQWNQWQQQYTQWQQTYGKDYMSSTQGNAGNAPPVPPSLPTSQAPGEKRAAESVPAPPADNKKAKTDTVDLAAISMIKTSLEEMNEAEKQFDEQFTSWEAQYETWKTENANHPDAEQYKAYEAKWTSWRAQLIQRREQMKKKRESKLVELEKMQAQALPAANPLMPPSSAAPMPFQQPMGMYGNFPMGYNQQNYMFGQFPPVPPPVMPPSAIISNLPSISNTQSGNDKTQAKDGGIPGLDLGNTSLPSNFNMSGLNQKSQDIIQTPADSKPFDFPTANKNMNVPPPGFNQRDSKPFYMSSNMNQSYQNDGQFDKQDFRGKQNQNFQRKDFNYDGNRNFNENYRGSGGNFGRDAPNSNRDFNRDGPNFNRDGSNFNRDGSNFNRDGPNFNNGSNNYRNNNFNNRPKTENRPWGGDKGGLLPTPNQQHDGIPSLFAKEIEPPFGRQSGDLKPEPSSFAGRQTGEPNAEQFGRQADKPEPLYQPKPTPVKEQHQSMSMIGKSELPTKQIKKNVLDPAPVVERIEREPPKPPLPVCRPTIVYEYYHKPALIGFPDEFEPSSMVDHAHEPYQSLEEIKESGWKDRSYDYESRDRQWGRNARREDRFWPKDDFGYKGRDYRGRDDRYWDERERDDRKRRDDRRRPEPYEMEDRWRHDRNQDDDRSKTPDKNKQMGASPPKSNDSSMKGNDLSKNSPIHIDELLSNPGRSSRPPRIVIILRGPPGSGKTYVAKLIKSKEVQMGGSAPRILSLDDYFMVETEKTGKDGSKTMEYEYEAALEPQYRESLTKSFKKTITDGYFSFVIVDCINDKVNQFEEMSTFAKQKGFNVYICEMELDLQTCLKRNIHKRSENDIETIIKDWEKNSNDSFLDIRSLLQDASITDVDMEIPADTEKDNIEKESNEKLTNEEDNNEKDDEALNEGLLASAISSKWDDLDTTNNKLDRLDGLSKARRTTTTIKDWLQLPEDDFEDTGTSTEIPEGKKRVRWADLEERRQQEKMRAIGFVVGQTDWSRMMDPTGGESKLTQTKYI